MTLKEVTILIEQLRDEIEQGIDVEFNEQWITLLQKSIVNSLKINKN
tara:strand:+ start:195 stop:335 length:141 start_codon:yes stop_codon:yes gene_type:complete